MQETKIAESYVTGRFPSKLQSSNSESHHFNSNIRETQFSFGNTRRSGREEQLTFGEHMTIRDSNVPLPQIETYRQNRITVSQGETYQVMPASSAVLVRSSPFDRNSAVGASYHNPNDQSSYKYNSSTFQGEEEVKSGCWCCKD